MGDDSVEEDFGQFLVASCGLPPSKALRVYQDVKSAARVFKRPKPPRPTRLLSELRMLEARLEAGKHDTDKPQNHLWPYLFVSEEDELEALIADPEKFLSAIQLGLEALEYGSELAQSRKGGPFPDPRLNSFVMRLSQFYQAYAKAEITFTIDLDTHQPSSPFARFVDEAINQFHPDGTAPPGQLRTALQETRKFLRNTEELTPEELDQLIPRDQPDQ